MNLIIALLLGAFGGILTHYLLSYLGLPAPLPTLGGVVVFLVIVFGRDRINF